jgi:hypothetical protein
VQFYIMLWFGLVFCPWKHGFTQFDNKVHLKSHLIHLAIQAHKIQITYYMNLNITIACSKTNKWTQQKERRIHFNGNVFCLSNANKIHPKIRCNKRNKHNELKRKRRRNNHLMEMKYQQKGIKLLWRHWRRFMCFQILLIPIRCGTTKMQAPTQHKSKGMSDEIEQKTWRNVVAMC